MSKLSDLYKAKRAMEAASIEFTPEQEKALEKYEEDVIKNDIIPIIEDSIAPALQDIEREIVLVVGYKPEDGVSVRLSRRVDLMDVVDRYKAVKFDQQVSHSSFVKKNIRKENVDSVRRLKIVFPDGDFIQEKTATKTLIKFVKRVGVMKVRAIGIKSCKIPLISNTKDDKYGQSQQPLGGGWFLMTNTSTKEKSKQIMTISKFYNLNVKVIFTSSDGSIDLGVAKPVV